MVPLHLAGLAFGDAEPVQCFRVAGPTFVTLVAAVFTGGVFIFPTFHLYLPAAVCGVGAAASS